MKTAEAEVKAIELEGGKWHRVGWQCLIWPYESSETYFIVQTWTVSAMTEEAYCVVCWDRVTTLGLSGANWDIRPPYLKGGRVGNH